MASVNLSVKQSLDITCMRNDTFKLNMDWIDANNNPIDLTGYTFKAQVRKSSTASTAILTFEDSDFTKDASGNLLMAKSSTDMNIPSANYFYDLQVTQTATGDVSTWLGGLFVVQEDVTE